MVLFFRRFGIHGVHCFLLAFTAIFLGVFFESIGTSTSRSTILYASALFNSANPVAVGRPSSVTRGVFREKNSKYSNNFCCRNQQPWMPPTTIAKAPTTTGRRRTATSTTTMLEALPPLSQLGGEEESLLVWITAFASSHIGMSAIRQTLITDVFGRFLANDLLGIVGTRTLKMPDFWPGDSSGTNELFPDIETTGRQLYRIFYTMVSFLTLGSAFSIYLQLQQSSSSCNNNPVKNSIDVMNALGSTGRSNDGSGSGELVVLLSYAVATLSGAFSLASLVNASPLGLMPSFRQKEGDGDACESGPVTAPSIAVAADERDGMAAAATKAAAGDTLLGITRDDGLKFDPRGLTRITRHPLILPVFPWGIATAVLMGGKPADAILFGGLSLYAVAGCYCQDLRVVREEGSVGTTFFGFDGESNNDKDDGKTGTETTNEKLRSFYDETSFLPFRALIDGRQSWNSMIREFPLIPFLIAIPSAYAIETTFLRILGVEYSMIL